MSALSLAVRAGAVRPPPWRLMPLLFDSSPPTLVTVWISLPNMNQVLGVFGAWAILSGLLQLGTALRRWKLSGAQWAMVLSGAQSALAGAFFIFQAQTPTVPSIATVTGYAGFGAFYFLVSALSLSFA
eukprot:gene42949-52483_t